MSASVRLLPSRSPRAFCRAQQASAERSRAVLPTSAVVLAACRGLESLTVALSVRSILCSTAHHHRHPYRAIITLAFTRIRSNSRSRWSSEGLEQSLLDTAATRRLLQGGFETGLCWPAAAAHTHPTPVPPPPSWIAGAVRRAT